MTEFVEYDINRALYSALDGVCFTDDVLVKYPGTEITPHPGQPFLSAVNVHLPTDQVSYGDGGFNRYAGTLSVLVAYPFGTGEMDAVKTAGEVVSAFKRGTLLTENSRQVRMIQPPYIGGTMEKGSWINVPVTVRWQSDNVNVS